MSRLERAYLKTPLGYLEVTGGENGVKSLQFLDFRIRINRVPHSLRPCIDQLDEYFKGKRRDFDFLIDPQGTEFQMKIWTCLRNIPYGKTMTYRELAEMAGMPAALRAVGHANATNPLSLIIPCHRVIGANGRLTGYAFGLWRKKWLLEHEHAFAQGDLFYR